MYVKKLYLLTTRESDLIYYISFVFIQRETQNENIQQNDTIYFTDDKGQRQRGH